MTRARKSAVPLWTPLLAWMREGALPPAWERRAVIMAPGYPGPRWMSPPRSARPRHVSMAALMGTWEREEEVTP